MVVVSLNLASSAVGCRNDEQEMSGQSYACDCSFLETSELDDLELAVCGLSTGEAMALAEECASDMVGESPQHCDCLRTTTTFCDIGSCDER
ncbi:MAG: hypothetical protein JRI68_02435 [Deltaproteobacteria bacterium]|nr:hypothetical protein [Deltaproteobacteria bacterium]